MFKKILVVFFLTIPFKALFADEGMWVPLLLEKSCYNHMKERGCRLSAEDIYSVNHSSIKDAVILFGKGCTGVVVSDSGLILTNYHCGYSYIQSFSTIDNDYLTNGFWASSRKSELKCPSLTVSFLLKMEDVTSLIFKGLQKTMNEAERNELINKNIDSVVKAQTIPKGNQVFVRSLYNENQYFLYEYEVYNDVRLVGAPPSGIGKFGGDTDNWIWPRHTGDFSIFRIYADKNNRPAPYSKDNVPLKPKKFLPISIKGVNENDFTMIYGNPGSTAELMTSTELEFLQKVDYPHIINLRSKRLAIIEHAMEANPATRIQYSAKYATISNSWKKWQGMENGFYRGNAVNIKRNKEQDFYIWANASDSTKAIYANVLGDFNRIFPNYSRLKLLNDYVVEGFLGIELMGVCGKYNSFIRQVDWDDTIKVNKGLKDFRNAMLAFYKNYSSSIDQKVFASLMQLYDLNVDPAFQPEIIKKFHKKYNNNFDKWSSDVFVKSVFSDKQKLLDALSGLDYKNAKKLLNDPAMVVYDSFTKIFKDKLIGQYAAYSIKYDSLYRIYTEGVMQMNKGKMMYPDANLTLRIAFGKVQGYHVADAVDYTYFTTLEGAIAKDNPNVYDYNIPAKLKELYVTKNYGPYADKDGKLHLCFLASNHTTGGNSGSPVINAEGELIGLNFDRNWEGTMNDMLYDPDQCRNISLDIRYLLFVVDKFAGAGYLLNEMKIINSFLPQTYLY